MADLLSAERLSLIEANHRHIHDGTQKEYVIVELLDHIEALTALLKSVEGELEDSAAVALTNIEMSQHLHAQLTAAEHRASVAVGALEDYDNYVVQLRSMFRPESETGLTIDAALKVLRERATLTKESQPG